MKSKVYIIVCILLIAVGVGLGLYGWNNLSDDAARQPKTLPTCGQIVLDITSCDVEVRPSQDGACHLTCWETEEAPWEAVEENGTLTIREQHSDRPWFMTLARLPRDNGPAVLELPGGSCDSLQIDATSGNIKLENLRAGTLCVDCTSGDVTLDGSDAEVISVDCTSGDVTAVLPTGKAFTVKATSGDVTVPPDQPEGGVCRIETTSGDITVTVAP